MSCDHIAVTVPHSHICFRQLVSSSDLWHLYYKQKFAKIEQNLLVFCKHWPGKVSKNILQWFVFSRYWCGPHEQQQQLP